MTNNKILYLIAASFLFWLGGSHPSPAEMIDPARLSGDIRLTLKRGVWKTWEGEPVYQDITLDLVCDANECDREVWGFAPKFNQADHQGILQTSQRGQLWNLDVQMQIYPDPWQSLEGEADYDIQLRLHEDNQLIGTYSGTVNDQPVKGEVQGIIRPHWSQPVANHPPLRPLEHPRLIFRQDQLPQLRQQAKTPRGEAILAQLQRSLDQPIYYDGYVPTGGYHAAGYCFLSLIQQDQAAATTAWQITVNSMNQPGHRLLEHSTVVAGVALAYDLCYPAWNEEQVQQVADWLATQTALLVKGTAGDGWNPNPASNWNARARGAAGLAALALLEEGDVETRRWLKVAERNIKRYLTIGIGDRGFGSEGDHYSTEPWFLTVMPFLQAYQTVLGEDLVTRSHAAWFLPQYVTRMVGEDGEVAIPTYGRHRLSPTGSIFAVGLGIVPERLLPGVMWFFNRHWGRNGDNSFGIELPHEAAYIFARYPQDVTPQNPAKVWGRVVVDEQKGFFTFRNQWRDENDFVTSIFVKGEKPRGGHWSFPDAGSFRIWGLGGRWATAGSASDGTQRDENVVLLPQKQAGKTAKVTGFQANPDGSGMVSLQHNNWLRSLAVDYSGASGVPGLFVLVDQVVEAEKLDQTWIMHTQEDVTIQGQQFTLEAESGATMQGTFVTPSDVNLEFIPSETGGMIQATGRDRFIVVMTVQSGTAPDVEVLLTEFNPQIQVGNQTIEIIEDKIVLKSLKEGAN
ncbi:MAG: hypothetical protein ACLFWI_05855 [Coleofasciculus sp.]|uniref:hypothetical protein n=1 Tax=Coleofasciculus sp. TaxID=3100458 RepID=UPI003A1CBC5B